MKIEDVDRSCSVFCEAFGTPILQKKPKPAEAPKKPPCENDRKPGAVAEPGALKL